MTSTISSDDRGARGLRPRLCGASRLIVVLAILAAGCSTPASSEPDVSAAPVAVLPETIDGEAVEDRQTGGGSGPVDSEELIGLGELGLLPSLLQSFGAGIECEFNDAFSTCQ